MKKVTFWGLGVEESSETVIMKHEIGDSANCRYCRSSSEASLVQTGSDLKF